jgi:hypothetical protein
MKYALFVYDDRDAWADLPSDDRRALHDPGQYQAMTTGSETVLAHHRLRPARLTTTVRMDAGELVTTEGPRAETRALRALLLLEIDDPDAVIEVAGRLPAVRMGGTVEIRPLIEPNPRDKHHGRSGS